jgi:uncharacterized membrane protein YhhN
MKKGLFIILFIFSVVGVFAGIVTHLKWFDYLCKPLIMISIGGYFLQNSKNLDNKTVRLALIAFLFSLFGDIFLMFSGEGMNFFMLGLGSFLVAQVFYIFLFSHSLKLTGHQSYISKNPFLLIGYLIYGGIVYYLLFNQLDIVLKIAVFVYMLAIMGMSVMALHRFRAVNQLSFSLVFAGSVLFVVSDTLIALDKFLTPIPNDRLLVMSTYMAAQFLIMKGILKQFE